MELTSVQKEHRRELADMVAQRGTPLGVGLRNQCFVGLAIEVAKSRDTTLLDYFGGTMSEWKTAIKMNNASSESVRNRTMSSHILSSLE